MGCTIRIVDSECRVAEGSEKSEEEVVVLNRPSVRSLSV